MIRFAALIAACAVAVPAVALADNWQPFARNSSTVNLADVDSIVVDGEVTSIRAANVPRDAAAGDQTHFVRLYKFKCATNESQLVEETEFGADGSQGDTWPEEDSFAEIFPDSLSNFLKEIACDGNRSDKSWPSIKDYIDGGRE